MSKPVSAIGVEPLGHGRYQVDRQGARAVAFAVTSGADTWVFLDGITYVVPEATGRPATRRSEDRAPLTAPMPATVLTIEVQPGQSVKRDDLLLVLEAMKMELPIRAPRDGVVTAIRCRQGELVQPGAVLLDLDGDDRP